MLLVFLSFLSYLGNRTRYEKQAHRFQLYIGIKYGLNNWNSSVDGIGMVIVKIKYLSNKKYCSLEKLRTTEKRDVERYESSLFDLKSRKVLGSSIGCYK